VEAFGIALYALAGLVAAPIFCFVVARFSRHFPRFSVLVWWASVGVFVPFLVVVTCVVLVGAIKVRAAVGPLFFPLTVFLALFAAPALACLLLIGRPRISRWWPAVAIVAWCLGVFAIFFQYGVADTLYGPDGIGGPYSQSGY
jgi:hypothetical protein